MRLTYPRSFLGLLLIGFSIVAAPLLYALFSNAIAFERLAALGELDVDDPSLAAAHFNWLIMSIPLNRAMLLGEDEPPGAAALHRYADAGVAAFLRAYGPAAVRAGSPDRRGRSAPPSVRER